MFVKIPVMQHVQDQCFSNALKNNLTHSYAAYNDYNPILLDLLSTFAFFSHIHSLKE